jgi:hypothetical protein
VSAVTEDRTVPALRDRRRADPRIFTVPLLVYAAGRLFQLAVLSWMIPANSEDGVRSRLLAWDAGWFTRVAQEGYPHGYTYGDNGALVGNGLAFFPGYPLLIRGMHEVTRLDYDTASLAVTWLAAAVAAVAVFALGRELYDDRVALMLTILFCAQPMSLVLSMGYSEAVFVALVASMLLAARKERWLTAGAIGLAAALTRPTGAAAAVALAVAALLAIRRDGVKRATARPRSLRSGRLSRLLAHWRPIVAAVVALAGVPAYLLWVGLRVGNPHAWFDIQTAGWGSTFDGGLSTFRFIRDSLRGSDGWVEISIAWLVLIVVVLAVIAVRQRVWPPLVVYGLIALVLVLGQGGYFHSKPRLLVPVLLILVPGAVALARARTSSAALVLVGYAAFGLWYGAYLVTVWHFAI